MFDVVFIEKPVCEGLNKTDITYLFDIINSDDVFPIEICDVNGNSSAMGFISPKAAEKLQYEYDQNSELGFFISSILDDMEKENDDFRYDFNGLNIWMGRNVPDDYFVSA